MKKATRKAKPIIFHLLQLLSYLCYFQNFFQTFPVPVRFWTVLFSGFSFKNTFFFLVRLVLSFFTYAACQRFVDDSYVEFFPILPDHHIDVVVAARVSMLPAWLLFFLLFSNSNATTHKVTSEFLYIFFLYMQVHSGQRQELFKIFLIIQCDRQILLLPHRTKGSRTPSRKTLYISIFFYEAMFYCCACCVFFFPFAQIRYVYVMNLMCKGCVMHKLVVVSSAVLVFSFLEIYLHLLLILFQYRDLFALRLIVGTWTPIICIKCISWC